MFSLEEILTCTQGRLLGLSDGAAKSFSTITAVSTDSRNLTEGSLFVALCGDRFDGHDFCAAAVEAKALLLLVSRSESVPSGAVAVVVEDTLLALQNLAKAYRQKLSATVIAVTGSVGKTSVRQAICQVLKECYRVHQTPANYNNEIGLPQTILSAPEDTEILVLEMGMRLRGEIATLTQIAKPNVAVITNVGTAHIERLGSREEIAKAKMEICQGLTGDSWLVVDGSEPLLASLMDKEKNSYKHVARIFSTWESNYSESELCLWPKDIRQLEDRTTFQAQVETAKGQIRSLDCILYNLGFHQVQNALFAIACGELFKVEPKAMTRALAELKPDAGRGRLIRGEKFLVIDDTYNASTVSMLAALDSLAQLPSNGRKVAILGGMLELGDYAEAEHYKVGGAAANKVDLLILYGDHASYIANGAREKNPALPIEVFTEKEALIQSLKHLLRDNDQILVKASQGYRMTEIVRHLLEEDQL